MQVKANGLYSGVIFYAFCLAPVLDYGVTVGRVQRDEIDGDHFIML